MAPCPSSISARGRHPLVIQYKETGGRARQISRRTRNRPADLAFLSSRRICDAVAPAMHGRSEDFAEFPPSRPLRSHGELCLPTLDPLCVDTSPRCARRWLLAARRHRRRCRRPHRARAPVPLPAPAARQRRPAHPARRQSRRVHVQAAGSDRPHVVGYRRAVGDVQRIEAAAVERDRAGEVHARSRSKASA